jgi:chromosome segregation ATPase
MLEERKTRLRDNFNKELEAEKQSLRDKAAKIKKDIEDANKELGDTKVKLNDDIEYLQTIKEDINNIFSEKAKIEKETVPTIDDLLADNVQYVALSKQLSELKAALDSVNDSEDNREKVAELESNKAQFEAEIANYQQQLATRLQYDRILALIDGINEEQKDLVRQLSELEKKEDIARQYQFRQNQLLEERINQHFKLVQWRLFKTVNNGGDSFEEPFCECYVGGIPYHAGLNQAARLNAGLDIINALCKFYNVAAPICLDNSESCINIMQTAGQQVRLQVTDTDLQLV